MFFLSCLCACTSKNHYAIDTRKINRLFSGNISVSYGEKLYTCFYKNTAEGQSELRIISPSEVEGLTFQRNSKEYTVSQNVTSLSSDEFFCGNTCFVKILNDIIHLTSNNDALTCIDSDLEKTIFKVNFQDYDCYLTVLNKSGDISNISIKSLKLVFDFLQ